ncbi:MAG: hypothetical protein O9340_12060 [Cyclobacteriaceae bacterium]|jgi:hypothetical protein|nr:hypothetical protein [Cyclobacteriaceae bacterium]
MIRYPITRSALADAYGISVKTLRIWLSEIGIEHNKTLSPAEIKNFTDHYGLPETKKITN